VPTRAAARMDQTSPFHFGRGEKVAATGGVPKWLRVGSWDARSSRKLLVCGQNMYKLLGGARPGRYNHDRVRRPEGRESENQGLYARPTTRIFSPASFGSKCRLGKELRARRANYSPAPQISRPNGEQFGRRFVVFVGKTSMSRVLHHEAAKPGEEFAQPVTSCSALPRRLRVWSDWHRGGRSATLTTC
jgi:hypothetical protein